MLEALDRIKRRWRKWLIRVIAGVMRVPPGGTEPWNDGAGARRVLFLQPKRLGDMMLSTGAIRAIAGSHAGLQVDVLATPASALLLQNSEHVREVIHFEKGKFWRYPAVVRRLRSARYDAVVDCVVNKPSMTTLLLMLASGAKHRIAMAGREGREDALTTVHVTIPPLVVHMAERLGALSSVFGVNVERCDWRPVVVLSAEERRAAEQLWSSGQDVSRARRFLVNVSVRQAQHVWPADRYVGVLRHLRTRDAGARLIVIGSVEEQRRAMRIAAEGGATFVATPGIRDALGLVATADFVFTPDTSIVHAASAFERLAVALFRPGYAAVWGLYRTVGRNLESDGPTLASLPLDRVLSAIDEVIAHAPHPTS